MTDHPLTETAAAELWDKHVGDTVPWGDWYGGSRRALTSLLRAAFDAAREHYTADDLRNTPGGRALMAEGWDQGWRDRRQYDQDIDWRTIPVTDTNPYLDGDA